ncbi:MAG: NUDIX hydrolase [Burkholderiales bacterium]|nr:NUDIX hydrolase [Burkholderiales bacterium]
MKENLLEETIESSLVYDGDLLKVRRDNVKLPNGRSGIREYIRHPGAVVVIAFLENGKLLMERQFRYPLGRVFVEMPAGKIDSGEDPLQCAKRELLEETGFTAASWREITTVHPCIGYSDEKLIYFHAADLSFSGKNLDEEEFIEHMELSLTDALDGVKRGEITDVKTVVGLFWAEKIAKGGWT